jgi:hypothetical protein
MWFATLVLIFGWAYPAGAYPINCEDCTCGHLCTRDCDFTSTCGAYGVCAGSPACTGCLTVQQIEAFDKPLRGSKDAAILSSAEERGEVAARLTWRLTQHVEESGLGTVFAGGTRFRLPFSAPALAFVHAGAPKDVQVPDLAVEFVTNPGRVDAVVAGWLSAGVRAVLTVDPSTRSVVVYQGQDIRTLGEADYLELPDVVPGWSLRVGELFE